MYVIDFEDAGFPESFMSTVLHATASCLPFISSIAPFQRQNPPDDDILRLFVQSVQWEMGRTESIHLVSYQRTGQQDYPYIRLNHKNICDIYNWSSSLIYW